MSLDLEAIRERVDEFAEKADNREVSWPEAAERAALDVPALIAEVERLRGQLAEIHDLARRAAEWRPSGLLATIQARTSEFAAESTSGGAA